MTVHGFHGWQRQQSPRLATVQGALESALSRVAARPIVTSCAGRTDAGVHATCQVVHFDCAIDRGNQAWTRGVNSLLPASIRVIWSQRVTAEFHARFSATARRYVYLMHCSATPSALLAGKVCPIRYPLAVTAMQEAAQYLLGEQDFSAFRAAGCQSRSPCRQVFEASVSQRGEWCVFDIRANGFLQHMVRNISGALIAIGKNEQSPQWLQQLLQGRDRTRAAAAAVPAGLYLIQVDYPAVFGLPASHRPPPYLPLPI